MRQIRDDERNGRPRSLPCLPHATGCSSAYSRCHIQSYTAIACNPLQPSCLIISTRVYSKILIVLALTELIHHEPVHREETPTHEPAVCANWCGLVAVSTSPAADWAFSGSPLVSLCGQCRDKVTQQNARGGVSEAAAWGAGSKHCRVRQPQVLGAETGQTVFHPTHEGLWQRMVL